MSLTGGGLTGIDAITDAERTKLAGIETGATADLTGAEIKTLYEAEADTNAYDDAAVTKLAGIEALADVTDATNVAAAGALMSGSNPTLVSLEGLSLVAGDILYATAADTLTRLAKGTALQTLRINSGATAPEWADAAAASGAWELVQTQAASDSATLDFTTNVDNTGRLYAMHIENIVLADDAQYLLARVTSDGGSNWLATGYSGGVAHTVYHSVSWTSTSGTSALVVSGPTGNASNESMSGWIYFVGAAQAVNTHMYSDMHYMSATTVPSRAFGGSLLANTTQYNGFRLIATSGNILSGNGTLYRVAAS